MDIYKMFFGHVSYLSLLHIQLNGIIIIIYYYLYFQGITSTHTIRQTCTFEKPSVCKPHYKSTRSQEIRATGNIKREFNEIMSSEQTDYCNTLEIISNLEVIKVSEIFDYVADRTDESLSAEFQVIDKNKYSHCNS
jgi:hypothetical protein